MRYTDTNTVWTLERYHADILWTCSYLTDEKHMEAAPQSEMCDKAMQMRINANKCINKLKESFTFKKKNC